MTTCTVEAAYCDHFRSDQGDNIILMITITDEIQLLILSKLEA